ACLERAVDPELEYSVGRSSLVEAHVRLDAIPPPHVPSIEQGGRALRYTEPTYVREVVVAVCQHGAERVRSRRRIEHQVVLVRHAAAPHVGDHRLRPRRRGRKTHRPRQLVPPAPDPPPLIPPLDPPIKIPLTLPHLLHGQQARLRTSYT